MDGWLGWDGDGVGGDGVGWDGVVWDGVRGCLFLRSACARLRAGTSRAERAGCHLFMSELRLGGRVCTDALYVPGLLLAPLTVHALLVCVLVLRSSLA